MNGSAGARAEDFVPLTERLVALQAIRALLVVVVVIQATTGQGVYANTLLGACACFGLVSVALELARRVMRRSLLPIIGSMLTFDVLFLGTVMVATGGPQSRLMFLIYLHLIAVTLLLSFRSGLKVAVGHSVAIFVSYYARAAGLVSAPQWLVPAQGPASVELQRAAVVGALGFWLVALVTAMLSALSERDLRRSKVQLRALADMGVDMEAVESTGEILERLLVGVTKGFGEHRVAAMALAGTDTWLANRTDDRMVVTLLPGDPGSVVMRTWDTRTPELVRHLGPEDGVLSRAIPSSTNVVVLPMMAEGQRIGALAVEFGGGSRSRVRSRQVEMLEQFGAHAALEIRNAWLLAEVRRLATTDALTDLPNRRSLQEALAREAARCARAERPMSVVLIDLDHFKDINDTHGHQMGDDVLRAVGKALADGLRAGDFAARYGGEEFCVLLPECDGPGAMIAAERIRAAVACCDAPVAVTASAGVASLPLNAPSVDALLAAADDALYEAKGAGRDCVVRSRRRRRRPSANLVA